MGKMSLLNFCLCYIMAFLIILIAVPYMTIEQTLLSLGVWFGFGFGVASSGVLEEEE